MAKIIFQKWNTSDLFNLSLSISKVIELNYLNEEFYNAKIKDIFENEKLSIKQIGEEIRK